jgi:Tfp pilus assembly protein PilO
MTLRKRDRIALGVVVIVALLGAYYFLALKPERQKSNALVSQIAGQKATLAQEQASYATGRAAQASLKADANEWAALHLAVPEQSNIPALLRTLEQTAHDVKVNMQAIALNGGNSGAAASTAPTGSSTASAAAQIPVQLTFSGGYNALNALVKRLEGLVVVSGGKVTATGPLLNINDVSLTGSGSLTVQITATIYQLGAPVATAATTGGS